MNSLEVNAAARRKPQQIIQATIPVKQDLETIKQAAESVGMSISAFTRFHVLAAARKVVSDHVSAS